MIFWYLRDSRGLCALGATPAEPVTVLSDGAEGPRFLGETARPPKGTQAGRIPHLVQTAKAGHIPRELTFCGSELGC